MSRRIKDHTYSGRNVMVPARLKRPVTRGRGEPPPRRRPKFHPALAMLGEEAREIEGGAFRHECPRGRGHRLYILRDDRWRLFCSSGCSEGDILRAFGRPPDVLRYKQPTPPRAPKEARYPYHEADGTLLFTAVRKLDVPPGGDRFEFETVGGKRIKSKAAPDAFKGVLYGLDKLLAVPIDEPLFWCEGEKDVESLWARGLHAVTTSCGAHAFTPHFDRNLAPVFQGRTVVILPDNDEPGATYAEHVKAMLEEAGAHATIVMLPGLPPKEDVSWWLAHGGKVDDLLKAARVPTFFKPTKAAPSVAQRKEVPLGPLEAAILAAIDQAEHRSVTTDALPMLVAGLQGEEAWNARAMEPMIRYPNVAKEDLARARARIGQSLGSLTRRGLIEKDGRRIRRSRATAHLAAPQPRMPKAPPARIPRPTRERLPEPVVELRNPLTCGYCGKVFEGTEKQAVRGRRGNEVFCSSAHKKAAWKEKHGERIPD